MELKGLKVNFLGDSITEGVGVSDRANLRYTSVFERETGTIVNNYGIGGTRITRKATPSANPRHDLCFLDRVEEMDPEADVVVVYGGTNDFGHGLVFGDPDDRDEFTFRGAMHSLILRLKRRFPNSEIVFMTPIHRRTEDTARANIDGRRLVDFVDAMMDITAYYGIPTLDLFRTSGIQPAVAELDDMTTDGLHPNDKGAARIAKRLAGFLSAL